MKLDDPDVALAAQAKAGSTAAFARLVSRHQQPLRAFLRRTCGDWALADDLAQETFLTAWERIGSLRKDQGSGPGFAGSVTTSILGRSGARLGVGRGTTGIRPNARPRPAQCRTSG